MKVRISVCTAAGKRRENQDCACATGFEPEQTRFWASQKELEVPREGIYAAVCDGIGSGTASQYIARRACESYAAVFAQRPDIAQGAAALYDQPGGGVFHADLPYTGAVRAANDVQEALRALHAEGGCTLVGGFLTPPDPACPCPRAQFSQVAVGDSVCYHYRPNRLDNAPLELMNYPQNLFYSHKKAGLKASPYEKCILQAHLGMPVEKLERSRCIQTSTIHELWPGDRILLCCDGLCQLPERLLEALLQLPRTTAKTLVRAAALAPHSDNVTAVLIDIRSCSF